ncbi:uncharacterized protein L203_104952 [Cryptococcus depauperatus CBS 7841]|uniref:Uncharacterized protein n=1 Tax=Cryptococcus depauperatus CBS 7841 TaxID=1295531 RepID=A0A1E3IMT5_9TREE|nr:hypothetical protein L203_01834 [Cryptococcus depauperatus CBS 7841]
MEPSSNRQSKASSSGDSRHGCTTTSNNSANDTDRPTEGRDPFSATVGDSAQDSRTSHSQDGRPLTKDEILQLMATDISEFMVDGDKTTRSGIPSATSANPNKWNIFWEDGVMNVTTAYEIKSKHVGYLTYEDYTSVLKKLGRPLDAEPGQHGRE